MESLFSWAGSSFSLFYPSAVRGQRLWWHQRGPRGTHQKLSLHNPESWERAGGSGARWGEMESSGRYWRENGQQVNGKGLVSLQGWGLWGAPKAGGGAELQSREEREGSQGLSSNQPPDQLQCPAGALRSPTPRSPIPSHHSRPLLHLCYDGHHIPQLRKAFTARGSEQRHERHRHRREPRGRSGLGLGEV